MTADPRWEEVKSIAGRAGELTGKEREDYLRAACRGDESLLAEVSGLLQAAEVDDQFLVAPEIHEEQSHFVLGEFRIQRELGRGAMAVVYLARQQGLEREVAVKVMVESLLTTAVQVERFHREARAVAKLRHPGIVRVFSDGQIDRTHWFAMEYVPGHDLAREILLQQERRRTGVGTSLLPGPGEDGHVAEVARVCAEIAEALHYAHEHGVIHRDVKPQNLLLDRNRNVQVVDFGLARDEASGHITGSGALIGTPHYMSPEQARSRQLEVDRRTDVYSLGVVVYELCTLRRPFEGHSLTEILTRIQRDEPTRPRLLNPRVPRDLETICLTALAKHANQRYDDAGAMAADLRRFLRHEEIEARPPGWAEIARRFALRHRAAVAMLAVLAIGSGLASWLTWSTVHAGMSARLSVTARDEAGTDLTGSVSTRLIDPITGVPGTELDLGSLPTSSASLPAGYYRILVRSPEHGVREYVREVTAGHETALEARFGIRNQADMAQVPGGTLALRDDDAPLLVLNDRNVPIEPFLIDRHEVTIGEYALFLEATGYPAPDDWKALDTSGNQQHPVVYVGWQDARAYAEWAGKRLPSFAEWNWVARGPEGRRYPWLDDGPVRGNASRPLEVEDHPLDAYLAKAMPVSSFPEAATASGVDDLFGNVSEWTETPLAEPTSTGFVTRMDVRLVAGHAWDAASVGERGHSLETFEWQGIERAYANHRIGFRCAVSLSN